MTKIRIGTFNLENYFSRIKLLSGANAKMKPLLEAHTDLVTELARDVYDRPLIESLFAVLEGYVNVAENKGRLREGKRVVAEGRASWEGELTYVRTRVPSEGQENTIRVIDAIQADILCCVEVEDRSTLKEIGAAALLTKKYRHAMLIEGNDDRGIDVGVLSRHPITDLRSHVDASYNNGYRIFSRDCLVATVEPRDLPPIVMLANHLKSQGYGNQVDNNRKRRAQADRIVTILQRYDLDQDYVVVAGDLNADRDGENRASLEPLLTHPGLVDVHQPLGADGWAYYFNGRQRLDYLLCSRALAARLTRTGIERRGMWNLHKLSGGAEQPFPTVTRKAVAASDHGALWAEFDL